jgi:hypothetical protein
VKYHVVSDHVQTTDSELLSDISCMYGLNRLICRENGMGKILKTIDLLVVVLILQHITVLINLQKGNTIHDCFLKNDTARVYLSVRCLL